MLKSYSIFYVLTTGLGRPQTNGKVERLHGEIQRKLHEFEEIMMRKSDPIDLFMQWYNHDRPHRSPDWDNQETSSQAFLRKMPKEETVIDGQTGGSMMSDKRGGGTNCFLDPT